MGGSPLSGAVPRSEVNDGGCPEKPDQLDSVKPLKLRQGEAFLELDSTARHSPTGMCVPVQVPGSPCAERAG